MTNPLIEQAVAGLLQAQENINPGEVPTDIDELAGRIQNYVASHHEAAITYLNQVSEGLTSIRTPMQQGHDALDEALGMLGQVGEKLTEAQGFYHVAYDAIPAEVQRIQSIGQGL